MGDGAHNGQAGKRKVTDTIEKVYCEIARPNER